MITKGQFVSRIRNSIRGLTKDDHISSRYILQVGVQNAKFYIKQLVDNMNLGAIRPLYNTIECFPMQEIDPVKCGVREFRRCSNLMVSKDKLPDLAYSKYGAIIVSVTNVDDTVFFDKTTILKYKNDKNRYSIGIKPKKVFYEMNGRLYIPDSTIKSVNVTLLTLSPEEIDEKSECSDNCECKSVWEHDFICPENYLKIVSEETENIILGKYKRVTIDENPNMNEHEKSKTVR